MKITNNFSLKELISSDTAKRENISNMPGSREMSNLVSLCNNVLQPLREFMGRPIKINSGYRSPKLNTKIGGSRTSSHMKGEASDIECQDDRLNIKMFKYILENLEFDQCIIYKSVYGRPRFVHVSYSKTENRNQALLKRDGGGYELTNVQSVLKEFDKKWQSGI